ncbi:MAG TPA: hypothetical protein VIU61_14375 [Kofleriaceae bacterium]
MFKPESTVFAERAGRIAFGAYLIAGAALTLLSLAGAGPAPWTVFVGSWAVAFAMNHVVRKTVGPREDKPDTWLLASLVVPGIGLALMLPLLVHLPIALLLGGFDGFDAWARMSVEVVGPTHVVLAILVTVRAVGLVRGWTSTPSPGVVYAACVAVSLAGSAALLFIPTIIVALTGLAVLPVLKHMGTLVWFERGSLDVPRAVALSHA